MQARTRLLHFVRGCREAPEDPKISIYALRSRLPAAHPAPERSEEASPVRINDVTQVGMLSMTAVPVFRAYEGTRVFAAVTGAKAVLAAPAVVEHVSCL